jgi:DNA-binding transcriptional ArsR family regulator
MLDNELRSHAALKSRAAMFAALGDETRLAVILKLTGGQAQSIARLTKGSSMTRQAVAKHLRVLEHAGLVRSVRAGRESLYKLEPQRIRDARHYLDEVSKQWDDALARLKLFVED